MLFLLIAVAWHWSGFTIISFILKLSTIANFLSIRRGQIFAWYFQNAMIVSPAAKSNKSVFDIQRYKSLIHILSESDTIIEPWGNPENSICETLWILILPKYNEKEYNSLYWEPLSMFFFFFFFCVLVQKIY